MKGALFVRWRDARKRSERKAIYSRTWEFTTVRNPSSAISPTVTWASLPKEHLTDHKRRHSGERPYICTVCKEKFMRSSILKIHMRKHTGKKSFKCHKCERAFSKSGHLRTHLRVHVGIIMAYQIHIIGGWNKFLVKEVEGADSHHCRWHPYQAGTSGL